MITFPPFARRRNQDSSIDSICTKRFQTIASAACEDDLAAHEREHVCNPLGEIVSRQADSGSHRLSRAVKWQAETGFS